MKATKCFINLLIQINKNFIDEKHSPKEFDLKKITLKRFKKNEIPELKFKQAVKKPIPVRFIQIEEPFDVETMEGVLQCKKGDYLLIGIHGEMYPVDREIFLKTYDIVD